MTTKRNDNDILSKIVFIIGIAILITSILLFGISSKPTEMGIGLVAGAITMAFGNLEKLKSFSGAGFSVELAERVKNVEVNIDTLKELVVVLANPLLSQMAWSGRMRDVNMSDNIKMRNDINRFMNKLDIQNQETVNIITTMNGLYAYDHLEKIRRAVFDNGEIAQPLKNNLVANIESGFSNPLNFNLSEFKTMIKELSIPIAEILELIKDFEFFQNSKELRRPEIWP